MQNMKGAARADSPPNPSRRAMLAGTTAALAAAAGFVKPPPLPWRNGPRPPTPGDDAELVALCQRFAERELDSWYRYVLVAQYEGEDLDEDPDWDSYHRIVATPATTAAGWHAKALAYTAWHRDAYDDHEDDRDSQTTLLASLLRDIVAPARNTIVARLAAQYGPLPHTYTPEGIWIGYTQEERALIDEENNAIIAEREARQEAELAEIRRRTNVETMTQAELEKALPGTLEMRATADRLYRRIIERLGGAAA